MDDVSKKDLAFLFGYAFNAKRRVRFRVLEDREVVKVQEGSQPLSREVPPWLQEQLARFEQLQQSLQAILLQKQQVELELAEIEKAVNELKKISPDDAVYKSAGPLLVKVKGEDVLKELEERRELANTRSMVLAKQEMRVRESTKELQAKIEEAIRSRSQPSGA